MTIRDLFEKSFGAQPSVCVRAPGRVNLIGEHIDYNGGHVMPLAIHHAVELALRSREDGRFRMVSAQIRGEHVGDLPAVKQSSWTDYVFGVVQEFRKLGFDVPGFDVAIDGSVPRGSGLSSSAALEVATAWAIQSLLGSALSRQEIALLAQRAENQFVGVNCGIMDQTASACSRAGHALLLDCNTLESEHIPLSFNQSAMILVAHSGVHRGLSASAYNERRSQCDAALEIIRGKSERDIPCLCAATLDDLEAASTGMDEVIYRRARHAIAEEARVRETVAALRDANLAKMGSLLNESHQSLRDDYEVSCPELDELTGLIRSLEGAYGARLTGAGFGGCAVALVSSEHANSIVENLKRKYYQAAGLSPVVFLTKAENGVDVV